MDAYYDTSENDVIPDEYYDSDSQELCIFITDLNDPKLYQKIIEKSVSIGGYRKLYYAFKSARRTIFNQSPLFSQVSQEYVNTCETFLSLLEI